MNYLTKEQMLQAFYVHGDAEARLDLDATMATVSDNPLFEYGCMDLRIEGRDGIREMYRRLFDNLYPKMFEHRGGGRRMFGFGDNSFWGEGIYEISNDDGTTSWESSMSMVKFEPDTIKVAGEFVYASPGFLRHLRAALGEDIWDLPGASRIDREQIELLPYFWFKPAQG